MAKATRMDEERALDLGCKLAGRKNMTDGELLESFGDWQRARAREERLEKALRMAIENMREGRKVPPSALKDFEKALEE
jgi:hypothetical protein